jgi:NADH dehydrogenase
LAYLQAGLLEMMPGPTLMSRDNLASMSEDNVLPAGAENALEKVFAINPQALDVLIK